MTMTPEQIAAKAKKISQEALERTAKRPLELQLDVETLRELFKVAVKYNQPIESIIKKWIQERLEAELSQDRPMAG